MSPVILSIIAIIICLIVIAIWNFNEGWTIFSIIASVLLAIFGLGMFGTLNTWSTREEPAKIFERVKGKHVFLVSTDRSEVIFKGGDVDQITDSTQFYWLIKYNHYNFETSRTLFYK